MKPISFDLSGRRILVTGGTGFIGGRLVERLMLEANADVRVLVRNFAHVGQIARFPIKMVQGDVTDLGAVERAMSDCDLVFHCAYGNQGNDIKRSTVNVEGTRNVLAAALQANVRRVVYLSTVMVYGAIPDGDLDEMAPQRYSGNAYADSKLDAERIAVEYVKKYSLPVVILQPTAVYGPFAPVWTIDVLRRLKMERTILINSGDGLCNAVYIDDMISAMLLAAANDSAVGEAFLISGEQPVTWRDFYTRYERMLGISGTVTMSLAEAEAYYFANQQKAKGLFTETLSILREERLIQKRLLQTRELSSMVKVAGSLLPREFRQSLKKRLVKNMPQTNKSPLSPQEDKPLPSLPPSVARFYAGKTRVCIDKARRILGYQPAFDFESGMILTEQWSRWANLLDS